jgi:hypothetical protein
MKAMHCVIEREKRRSKNQFHETSLHKQDTLKQRASQLGSQILISGVRDFAFHDFSRSTQLQHAFNKINYESLSFCVSRNNFFKRL